MAVNWAQEQPIVAFVRRWVSKYFPAVSFHYDAKNKLTKPHPSMGIGGYNNRTTAAGGFSAHSEGRAVDIYLDAGHPYMRQIGDALFNLFKDFAADLEVEEVIWNRQIWSTTQPTVHKYLGKKPHTDHVHVAFTRSGSQKSPPLLITLLERAHLAVEGSLSF